MRSLGRWISSALLLACVPLSVGAQDTPFVSESIKEAALGGPLRTPTTSGAVMLNVPAGANSGTLLRLKGKGVAGKGDQIVRLRIVMPKHPDEKLNDFLKTWTNTDDPRREKKAR